jgi:hypothetical protein
MASIKPIITPSITSSIITSFGDDVNRLLRDALVDLNADGIVSSAGAVTRWNNSGSGGSAYDLATVIGTAANLREHDSGAILLDGASGSFASTPNSPANSITGDCILCGYVKPNDNTPADRNAIIGKWDDVGGNNRSYLFNLDGNVSGTLEVILSHDGSASSVKASSLVVPYADGVGYWAFAVIDVGASITFYTTDTLPPTATFATAYAASTQLGSVITGIANSIHDGPAALEIGSYNTGTSARLNGQIYRAGIIAGLDATATPAVDCDPRQAGRSATGVDGDSWFGAEMLTPTYRDPANWAVIGAGTITDNNDGTVTFTDSDASNNRPVMSPPPTTIGAGSNQRATITISCPARTNTTQVAFIYSGGTQKSTFVNIDWTALTATLVPAAGVTSSLEYTVNADDSISISFEMTEGGHLNTLFNYSVYPFIGASVTGSIVVHGLVSLQSEWTLAGGAVIQNSGKKEAKAYGGVGIETTVAPALITTPMTIFLVGKADVLDSGLFQIGRSDGLNGPYVLAGPTTFDFNAGSTRTVAPSDTNPHLFTTRHNGDVTSSGSVSGVGITTGSIGTEGYDYGTLFTNTIGNGNFLTGSIGRHIIFDRALTDLEVALMQRYLIVNSNL